MYISTGETGDVIVQLSSVRIQRIKITMKLKWTILISLLNYLATELPANGHSELPPFS